MTDDLRTRSADILLTVAALTGSLDSGTMATLLYMSHWVPLTPGWLRRVPDASAVERLLFAGSSVDSCLDEHWDPYHDDHWLHWQPRIAANGPPPRFKLYVSATPDDAGPALCASLGVMAEIGSPPFKVARQARAMLRPDRMVIYLRSEPEMRTLAAALVEPLQGLRAQGVPFTAALHSSLILSWGCDPPSPERLYGARWRRWLTKKLAAYLHASDAPSAEGRVEMALRRLGEDGVDGQTWEPRPGLWE